MFYNISNHRSAAWSAEQIDAAKDLGGEIEDFAFPNVDPQADEMVIAAMARAIARQLPEHPQWAMVQGESSLTFALSRLLLAIGWRVVVACTARDVVDNDDGTKTTRFSFVRFRRLK